MKAAPELWQAVVSECRRRDAAWARSIDAAEDTQQRWKRVEHMNADMLLWHRIALVVAKAARVDPQERDAVLRDARPPLPVEAAEWQALPATARKTLDQALQRGADDMIRDLHPLWRWLHLFVHIWKCPAQQSANPTNTERNVA